MSDQITIIEDRVIVSVDEQSVEVVSVGVQGPAGIPADQAVELGAVESNVLVLGELEADTLAPVTGAGYSGGGSSLTVSGGRGKTGDQFGGSLVLQGGAGIGSGNAGSVSIRGGNAEDGLYPGNVSINAGSNSGGQRGSVYVQDLADPQNPSDAVNLRTLNTATEGVAADVATKINRDIAIAMAVAL